MIYYRGFTIKTDDYAGFWGIYKNSRFITLTTQSDAIQWIDLDIDYFNSRNSM